MEKLLFSAAIVLLAFATESCTKETAEPTDSGLVGEWEWEQTSGGLAGGQSTPASTGVRTTLVFKQDNTFQRYQTQQGQTSLVETTTYSLGTLRSIRSGQSEPAVTINYHSSGATTVQPQTTLYKVDEDGKHLHLSDNYYDGFGSSYQRK